MTGRERPTRPLAGREHQRAPCDAATGPIAPPGDATGQAGRRRGIAYGTAIIRGRDRIARVRSPGRSTAQRSRAMRTSKFPRRGPALSVVMAASLMLLLMPSALAEAGAV